MHSGKRGYAEGGGLNIERFLDRHIEQIGLKLHEKGVTDRAAPGRRVVPE